VPTDLQKRFVDGVVDAVKGMTVGDPSDPETFIGPWWRLASKSACLAISPAMKWW
jgi:hypothetical protein